MPRHNENNIFERSLYYGGFKNANDKPVNHACDRASCSVFRRQDDAGEYSELFQSIGQAQREP